MSEKNTSEPIVVAEDKMLENDYLSEEDNTPKNQEFEGSDDSDEGENPSAENTTPSDTEGDFRVGKLAQKLGENQKDFLTYLKDESPELLQKYLEKNPNMEGKAKKWGLVDSAAEKNISELKELTEGEKLASTLKEDEVNMVIGKREISAENRIKIETKAKEILSAGVVKNSDIAIKTAMAELGFADSLLGSGKVGAVVHSGGGSGMSGKVSQADYLNMGLGEQTEYRKNHGLKFA